MSIYSTTTYVSRPDSSRNRYSYSVIRNETTGKSITVNHGYGDGTGNARAIVAEACGTAGYDIKSTTHVDIPIRRFNYSAFVCEFSGQTSELLAAIRDLADSPITGKRLTTTEEQRGIAAIINALDTFKNSFAGHHSNKAAELMREIVDQVERQGWVASFDGGSRLQLYTETGIKGKAILARRKELR